MPSATATTTSYPTPVISTGRGDAGNNHRSQSRGPISPASPVSPGRDPSLSRTDHQQAPPVTPVGREGAGNFRDSANPREFPVDPAEVIHEHEVIEHFDGSPHRFSTGRGSAGNMQVTDRSLSRERTQTQGHGGALERSLSRVRSPHSTGRGGAGNITSNTLHEEEDELERRAYSPHQHHHAGELHSTGRGGLANVTVLDAPPIDDENVYENGAGGVDGGKAAGTGGAGTGGVGTGGAGIGTGGAATATAGAALATGGAATGGAATATGGAGGGGAGTGGAGTGGAGTGGADSRGSGTGGADSRGAGTGVVSIGRRRGAGNIHERRYASRGPGIPGAPRSQSRGRTPVKASTERASNTKER